MRGLDDLSEHLGLSNRCRRNRYHWRICVYSPGLCAVFRNETRDSGPCHNCSSRRAQENRGSSAGENNTGGSSRLRHDRVVIVILCCWIVSFFFNGIESGLLSIDPVRLRQNVKRRLPAALKLNRLLKHPERLLATVLLVTNAADIIALLLLTSQLVRWYGYAGFFFALLIALPVYLFVLSVLPKVVVPAISLSRTGTACRRARIHLDFIFTASRTRRATGQATPAGSRWKTGPPFCCARGTETDHDTKRARGRSYCDRARDDSQRR